MTSGNHSDEPQIIDDAEVLARLGGIAEFALIHDRADRDPGRRFGGARRWTARRALLRRGRGYAPAPIALPEGFADAPDLLAMGGELKAPSAWSRTARRSCRSISAISRMPRPSTTTAGTSTCIAALFDHRPAAIAVDLHPEYLSAKLARDGPRRRPAARSRCSITTRMSRPASPKTAGRSTRRRCWASSLDGLGWGDDGTTLGRRIPARRLSRATGGSRASSRWRCRAARRRRASRGATSTPI